MAGIQGLKKKLKSIEATGKLSKALKTVATVKFSRLHQSWKTYSGYAKEYRPFMELAAGAEVQKNSPESLLEAPELIICIGSARGFCGGFNANLVAFVKGQLERFCNESADCTRPPLLAIGEHFTRQLKENGIVPDAELELDEVPSFADTDKVIELAAETVKTCMSSTPAVSDGVRSIRIAVLYPAYKNTLLQVPEALKLTYTEAADDSAKRVHSGPREKADAGSSAEAAEAAEAADSVLWLPDRPTVLEELSRKAFRTLLYGCILEAALGAQAATLVSMRSAYDASQEYSESLEREIQRRRQSQVTADVIEISSDRGQKGE